MALGAIFFLFLWIINHVSQAQNFQSLNFHVWMWKQRFILCGSWTKPGKHTVCGAAINHRPRPNPVVFFLLFFKTHTQIESLRPCLHLCTAVSVWARPTTASYIFLSFLSVFFFSGTPGLQPCLLIKQRGWEARNLVYWMEITSGPSPTWSEYLIGVIIKVATTERR